MGKEYPSFDPETQSLENYLRLMDVAFAAQDITEENEKKKVSLILTHIPTNYFDDVLSLVAPKAPLELTLQELTTSLKSLFKPTKTIVKNLCDFQDRIKSKDENYANFFKDLNRLAELCEFKNKEEFLKYKLFIAARSEPFFVAKFADLDYHKVVVLKQLSNLEAAYLDDPLPEVKAIKKIKCKVCGKTNHEEKNCRLRKATCYTCGSKGHVSSVCKKHKDDSGKYTEKVMRKNKQANKSSNKGKKERIGAHDVNHSSDSDSSIEEGNYSQLNKLEVNKTMHDPIMVNCYLQGKKIPFELDTGSGVSTIRLMDYEKLDNIPLEKSTVKLRSYNSSKITIFGEIIIKNFKYNNISDEINLYVVDNNCSNNLLGRDVLLKFKMISINQIKVNDFILGYNINENKPIKGYQAKLYPKPGHVPPFQNHRIVPFHLKSQVEDALHELINSKIIEPVEHSDYASPIVPVMKQNGSIRICVDFRKLNLVLHESKYPLPVMSDLVSTVAGHKFYSKVDLTNAYLQLEVDPNDTKYLVINTSLGLFKYNRLPFGLHSSPAIFQNFMSNLLSKHDGAYPYLDDIIICGNTKEEHDSRVRKVLYTLQNANVKINFNKSEFSKSQIKYLGFTLDKEGYRPDLDKVKSIEEAPVPETITQ